MLQPWIRPLLLSRLAPHRLPRQRCPFFSTSIHSTSSSIPPPRPPPRPNRFSAYFSQLRQQHPHIDPASLLVSFLVLHELTAIVPLLLGFWGFKALGLGQTLVQEVQDASHTGTKVEGNESYFKAKLSDWLQQGEEQAQRLGSRYGWFGMEKLSGEQRAELKTRARVERETHQENLDGMTMIKTTSQQGTNHLSLTGDVANLVASYVVVKALLPLRIYASLRLAPTMANTVMQRFHGLRSMGKRYLSKRPNAVGGPPPI
ncbi:BQ2448_6547 [Microbotryum intermedium]|uniref:BQ2448_6547 protein n=1 Tax=Microbotryum intermedium TaxID=269621 RepID=A0A238FLS9_9BASI|nr:BQ2448_6547 [Microbotryum intermedium]